MQVYTGVCLGGGIGISTVDSESFIEGLERALSRFLQFYYNKQIPGNPLKLKFVQDNPIGTRLEVTIKGMVEEYNGKVFDHNRCCFPNYFSSN